LILETIHDPRDIKALNDSQTQLLCTELREFLLKNVSKTGGHLASNLGAVELTVAIHRVFDTSRDRLVFDVGHQCYVHKILTGRADRFPTLRQLGGISGFPKPRESGHDAFIAGHASNSVSLALGMARARTMLHEDYSVLALIGDGALTGGLAYGGLNNAGASGEPLIVILNDNGMSIDRNVGAMSEHLSRLRTKPEYFAFKKAYHNALSGSARRTRALPLQPLAQNRAQKGHAAQRHDVRGHGLRLPRSCGRARPRAAHHHARMGAGDEAPGARPCPHAEGARLRACRA